MSAAAIVAPEDFQQLVASVAACPRKVGQAAVSKRDGGSARYCSRELNIYAGDGSDYLKGDGAAFIL